MHPESSWRRHARGWLVLGLFYGVGIGGSLAWGICAMAWHGGRAW